MRPRLPFPLALAAALFAAPALAQVSDAERAVARELFHAGDELQRSGHFVEALDKFQRAQQVFRAPTNLLRIAECEAAVGHLVESAEAYREVSRTTLPSDAPPAFQAAVDQARAELAQVEPRVPRVVVQVQPANVPGLQLQIDGQPVPTALLGEPLPLDPGPHKVAVRAPGFAPSEEQLTLPEHETKTVSLTLKPIAPGTPPPPRSAPAPAPALPAPPQSALAPLPQPQSALAPLPQPQSALAPPPPPPPERAPPPPPLAPPRSNRGVLAGAHIGGLFAGGNVPTAALPIPTTMVSTETVQATTVSGGGFAYGLDGGIRFARQVYVGLDLEHATLGSGRASALGVETVSSNTTSLSAVLGFIVDPDRPSFYVDLTAGVRWYHLDEKSSGGGSKGNTLDGGELGLGAGVWIPAGRNFRLLPKASLSAGSFTASNDTGSTAAQHFFVMVGIAGFFSSDF